MIESRRNATRSVMHRCRVTPGPGPQTWPARDGYFKCRSHMEKIFDHVFSAACVSYTARSGKQKP